MRFIKSLIDENLISTLSFTQDTASYNALASADVPVIGLGVSGSLGGCQGQYEVIKHDDKITITSINL